MPVLLPMRFSLLWTIIGSVKLLPLVALVLLAAAVLAGPAAAAEVAYVGGGQIWVSTLDGTQKRSLSGPSPDARVWTETAQADGGAVLGVRREPGKISQLNATTLWGPDGSVLGNGALTPRQGWSTYAFPVTLDLTPDGGTVTYSYANTRGFYPTQEFAFGTYVEGSSNWYIDPFDVDSAQVGRLAGNRLVGLQGDVVYLQRPSGAPYTNEFDPWFEVTGADRVDVASNGTVAAVEIDGGAVAMVPFAGLGAPVPADGSDCFLPTVGAASDVSIAPDGSALAWHDSRGVVVAGAPVWFASAAVSTCNLASAPVLISASGEMPSIGASTAALSAPTPAAAAAPNPSANPPRLLTAPKSIKAAALRRGIALKVKVARAGKVTATGKVDGKLVARGSKRAKRAGTVTVKLKAVKAYRGKLASLVGKKLKVKIKAGGRTTTLTRTLR